MLLHLNEILTKSMFALIPTFITFSWLSSSYSKMFERTISYCPLASCHCVIVVVLESVNRKWVLERCQERGMNRFDHMPGISEGLHYISTLVNTVELPPDGNKIVLGCSYNMTPYDEHMLETTKFWSGPFCDGLRAQNVTLKTKCYPMCSQRNATHRQLVENHLLNYWDTGNITSASGGCQRDIIEVVPCCYSSTKPPDDVEIKWQYNELVPNIEFIAQCRNLQQRKVEPSVQGICSPGLTALSWPDCSFGSCVLDEGLNGENFKANLRKHGLIPPEEYIISSPQTTQVPVLTVVCVHGARLQIQTNECTYNKTWSWNQTILQHCFQPNSQGKVVDIGYSSYLTTITWNSECFILPAETTTRKFQKFCDAFGGGVYVPHMPLQGALARNLLDSLEVYGQRFWLGHKRPYRRVGKSFIEWNDGTPFQFSYTEVEEEHEFMGNLNCFVLDVTEPDHYVLVDCTEQHLELCYLNFTNPPFGEWSEWTEWRTCRGGVTERVKLCSVEHSFCSGCQGVQPVEIQYCCDSLLPVQHGRPEFENIFTIRVTCDEGYTLADTSQSTTYTCHPNNQVIPACIPKSCLPLPELGTDSQAAVRGKLMSSYSVGDVVIYDCKDQLVINGTNSTTYKAIECLSDQTWSGLPPICVAKWFYFTDLLKQLQHVLWEGGHRKVTPVITHTTEEFVTMGNEINLRCREGYRFADGHQTAKVKVTADGLDEHAECIRSHCNLPPIPTEHSYIASGHQAQFIGSSITYRCLPGFIDDLRQLRELTLVCSANETWVGGAPLKCTVDRCAAPLHLPNGVILEYNDRGFYSVGQSLQVVCNDTYGIEIDGKFQKSLEIYCNRWGQWSHIKYFQCKPIVCKPLEGLVNAYITPAKNSYVPGNKVSVRCFLQHSFIGTSVNGGKTRVDRTCLEDGSWGGHTTHHCYTYNTQFGVMVDTLPNPGHINISWVNTRTFGQSAVTPIVEQLLKSNQSARFTIYFLGKDDRGYLRVNISIPHTATRADRLYTMQTVVPAGFYYSVWVTLSVLQLKQKASGKPHAEFYAPTGIPALAVGFTRENMVPLFLENFRTKDYTRDVSTIQVKIEDIFSPVNGSVHRFNLIVIEMNVFLTDSYLNGTIEKNLTTWAKAQDFPHWPPYQIHEPCQLFTGAGCPDVSFGVGKQRKFKRLYSAKDPIFRGDDAFASSLSRATGLEDVEINNDNLFVWTKGARRQANRKTLYTIGSQSCDKEARDVYCNGLLKHSTDYCIKLRAYTNDFYLDSPCAFVIEDKGSQLVQWSRAQVFPLLFAWVPFCILLAFILGIALHVETDEDAERQEVMKIRQEKRKAKARKQWKTAIFKAYDAALTVDNDQAVNLLAVASDKEMPFSNFISSQTENDTRRRIQRKCSYFVKNRKWFYRMNFVAYTKDTSETSLNEVDDELYNPNQVVEEHHVPYGLFQEGELVKKHYLLRKSVSDSRLPTSYTKNKWM